MELITLGNKLTDIVWMRYFIEYQGYDLNEYIVYQYNLSALLLKKNGRVSSSKQTKHIKTKYFLIKDNYEADENNHKFCPTDEMWELTFLLSLETCELSSRIAPEIVLQQQH